MSRELPKKEKGGGPPLCAARTRGCVRNQRTNTTTRNNNNNQRLNHQPNCVTVGNASHAPSHEKTLPQGKLKEFNLFSDARPTSQPFSQAVERGSIAWDHSENVSSNEILWITRDTWPRGASGSSTEFRRHETFLTLIFSTRQPVESPVEIPLATRRTHLQALGS